MSYDSYKDNVEKLIKQKLKEIEEKENVQVIYAAESGSRAWGLESPDSDYDVRFIYVRPEKYYLELQQKKDFIDWELNEVLDINGWDLTKALQHFHKGNATLFEWGNSPVIYYSTPQWEKVKKITAQYFSCKSAMYHYYGTANKNYAEYLTEDMVKYKKYFYVLRPILACKWIEKNMCPPPVLFSELSAAVLEESMKAEVEKLIETKKKMAEIEKGKKIEKINKYIEENILHFKNAVDSMADDRNSDWEALNKLFREMLI